MLTSTTLDRALYLSCSAIIHLVFSVPVYLRFFVPSPLSFFSHPGFSHLLLWLGRAAAADPSSASARAKVKISAAIWYSSSGQDRPMYVIYFTIDREAAGLQDRHPVDGSDMLYTSGLSWQKIKLSLSSRWDHQPSRGRKHGRCWPGIWHRQGSRKTRAPSEGIRDWNVNRNCIYLCCSY